MNRIEYAVLERLKILSMEVSKLRRTLRLMGLKKKTANKLSASAFFLREYYVYHNGPKWTAARIKTIFKVVAGEISPEPKLIRGLGGSWNCLPAIFRPLIRAGKYREVLTALSIFRDLKTEVDFDIDSITRPTKGSEILTGKEGEAFKQAMNQLVRAPATVTKRPALRYVARRLWFGFRSNLPILWSSKKGPNGPALGTIERDLRAIIDSGALKNVSTAWKYFKLPMRLFSKQGLLPYMGGEPCLAARLVAIQDKACKTRVVAIGDYFTQISLAMVHHDFMGRLARLPFDGTKSHRGAAARLLKVKGPKVSIDLKTATDRFPAELQKLVVEASFPGFSQVWRDLLNVDFSSPIGDVRYAVGQGMGFLSSWPVFAFTNHALALAASCLTGFTRRGRIIPKHMIVGDDIVFTSTVVANEYARLLDILDVQYTRPQFNSNNSFEFCKRFILQGRDISPVTRDIGSSDVSSLQGLNRLEGIKIPPARVGQLRWKQHNWKILAFHPHSSLRNSWGITPEEFTPVLRKISAASLQSWVRKNLKRSALPLRLKHRSRWLSKRVKPLTARFRAQARACFHLPVKQFIRKGFAYEFSDRCVPRDRYKIGCGSTQARRTTSLESHLLKKAWILTRMNV
jgi:hypothetical protein